MAYYHFRGIFMRKIRVKIFALNIILSLSNHAFGEDYTAPAVDYPNHEVTAQEMRSQEAIDDYRFENGNTGDRQIASETIGNLGGATPPQVEHSPSEETPETWQYNNDDNP